MRRSARRRLPPIQGMMGVDIESKTFTVWINRCQARRALCTEQEPWLDLQGQSAGTADRLDVDASTLSALLNIEFTLLGRTSLLNPISDLVSLGHHIGVKNVERNI
jgi:hypothetical protein